MNATSPFAADTAFLRQHINRQKDIIFDDLREAVSFPSVFLTNTQGCRNSAEWVQAQFAQLGIELDIMEGCDGSFALFGHVPPAEGYPTVMLYCHHDVQPANDQPGWETNPWELTEKDGRWYGRGAADDKGNLVMHLAALRALLAWSDSQGCEHPYGGVGLRVVIEGSEEAGGEGLEDLLANNPELFEAQAMLIADTGNVALGKPTINVSLRGVASVSVSLRTLTSPVHSGQYGGPAPDALFGLTHMLASLRDSEGGLTIDDMDASQTWEGVEYSPEDCAKDAGLLEGVRLCSAGTPAELAWARPTVTITGLDATPTSQAINAIPSEATALLNLRVPPTMDPEEAAEKLIAHLERRVPWGAHATIRVEGIGSAYLADTSGHAHRAMVEALALSYDVAEEDVLLSGEGGSIPLCGALKEQFPHTQLVLFGVEEPQCGIHGPNESVDPQEIQDIAVAEALFLAQTFPQA